MGRRGRTGVDWGSDPDSLLTPSSTLGYRVQQQKQAAEAAEAAAAAATAAAAAAKAQAEAVSRIHVADIYRSDNPYLPPTSFP